MFDSVEKTYKIANEEIWFSDQEHPEMEVTEALFVNFSH